MLKNRNIWCWKIFQVVARRLCKTHRSMKRFNHYCLFFRFLHNFFNSGCSSVRDSLQLNLKALLKRTKISTCLMLPMENKTEWPGTHEWNINKTDKDKVRHHHTLSSMSFLSRSVESMWTLFRSSTFCWTSPLISLNVICHRLSDGYIRWNHIKIIVLK